jgi:hypothetical protein
MRRISTLTGLSWGLIAIMPAAAADLPVKARPMQPAPYDWSGFYFGSHFGYGGGVVDTVTTDPTPVGGHNTFGGALGGAQFGYNHVFKSGVLLGFESDVSFMNYLEANPIMASVPTPAGNNVTEQLDYLASVRARFGHVFGPMMAYATGGFAYSGGRVSTTSRPATRRRACIGGPDGSRELELNTRSPHSGRRGLSICTAASRRSMSDCHQVHSINPTCIFRK